MKPLFSFLLFSISLLLVVGCNKDSALPVHENMPAITFRAGISDATKGTPLSAADAGKMESMGVFISNTGESAWVSGTSTPNFQYNKELKQVSNLWSYADGNTYYYPGSTSKYTFFGYTPYGSDTEGTGAGNGIKVTSTQSAAGIPTLTYTVPSSSSNQPDLMLAAQQSNLVAPSGAVSLSFHHALACIGVKVAGKGEVVTGVSISNVYGSGSVPIAASASSNIIWTPTGSADKTFTATVKGGSITLNSTAQDLLDNDGYFMMIPQTLSSGAKLTLTFSDNTTKELSLPAATSWSAGQRLAYSVTLGPLPPVVIRYYYVGYRQYSWKWKRRFNICVRSTDAGIGFQMGFSCGDEYG